MIESSLVAQWQLGAHTHSLIYDHGRCRFKFENAQTGEDTAFKTTLYERSYACSLVRMFHRTIGVNLANEPIDTLEDGHFFPKLCIRAEREPEIQVALFGWQDNEQLKGLRWGVYHETTREEQTFEGEEDHLVRDFITHAPGSNKPDMQSIPVIDKKTGEPVRDSQNRPLFKLDSKGQEQKRPGAHHYAMSAYIQHFRVSLIRDEDQRIQKIALRYVSLLDPTISLDENRWAVTLISTSHSNRSFFTRLFNQNFGHAMVACEGVERGQPFLKYIHFTQRPQLANSHPNLKDDEGQLEILEHNRPKSKTCHGPTWIRPKIFVQHMLDYAQKEENRIRKFALYGNFFKQPSVLWSIVKYDLIELESADLQADLVEISKKESYYTCLSRAYELMLTCGIIFQPEGQLRTPLEKIELLKSAPVYQIPNGFNHANLNKYALSHSTNREVRQISQQILSACVVLAPEDCSLSDLDKWASQTVIEETVATNEEIERVKTASLFSIWDGYTPKRW